MVRVKLVERDANENLLTLQQSAEQTAIAVHDEMLALVNSTDPRVQVDPNHITVLLQNFGDTYWGGHTKFLHPSDAVDVDVNNDNTPDWPFPDDAAPEACQPSSVLSCDTKLLQPWMIHGRQNPALWMEYFLDKLDELCDDSNVYPSRFDFDTELFLTTLGNGNLPFLLGRMVSDPRWDTVDVPGSGQTMKELWQELSTDGRTNRYAAFEATKGTIYPNEPAIANPWSDTQGPSFLATQSEPFEKKTNRDIFLWVSPIFQRAVDALMNEVAYEPIRQFGLNNGNRIITCSNYGHQWTDGLPQRIDWAYDLAGPVPVPCVVAPCGLFPRSWVRNRTAGVQDSGRHGGVTIPLSSGEWLIDGAGSALGGSSAPVLYLAGSAQQFGEYTDNRVKVEEDDLYYVDSYRQYDVYRKTTSTSMPPRESRWDASLKQHERTLDAIVRARHQNGSYDIAYSTFRMSPWLMMPGSIRSLEVDPESSAPQNLTIFQKEDFVDQLWLMRRKRVPTLLLWDAVGYAPSQNEPAHDDVAESYLRVYSPYMSDNVTCLHGTFVTGTNTERLEDNVPRRIELENETYQLMPHVLEVDSAPMTVSYGDVISYQQAIAFKVIFHDLVPGKGLKLRIECATRKHVPIEEVSTEYPNLRIYIYNHALEDYVAMPVNALTANVVGTTMDDDDVSNGSAMKFWAPTDYEDENDDQVHEEWKSLRRNIIWSPSFTSNLVNSSGELHLKVVLETLNPFTTRFDLLQIMSTLDDSAGVGPESLTAQGGDMDYDLIFDSTDVDIFLNEYTAENASADMNNDDVIDWQDVSRFADFISEGV